MEKVSILIYWIIVPVIMLALFIFACKIVRRAPNPEAKTSANAGLWAGLILFFVFVISRMNSLKLPEFSDIGIAGINFRRVLIGTIIGIILFVGVRYLLPTRRVGFIVLIFIACSTFSLYSYFFIADIRNLVLSLTLGVGLGALLHIMILPSSVKNLF
jgi:hypothetical protein